MEKIKHLVQSLKEETVSLRRDFHQYPEVAWTEFRTAAIVAEKLSLLGYNVYCGKEVICEQAMMGVPSAAELAVHQERAINQGAKPEWVSKLTGGKTGVMGVMNFGKPGPVVALRFDMDANDAVEIENEKHRPFAESFSSKNKGAMHACGHDGHTAIGLTVAKVLAELKDELAGTVKMIFQPAEEGVRGAKAMVEAGIVDDVNYLFGMHIGFKTNKTGQVACMTDDFLATTKLDGKFSGVTAHAGAAPEAGKNALLAAAVASVNLHAISRHSQGTSRINVGVMNAGTGRNVVPDTAVIKLETRGTTTAINEFMCDEAKRIITSAAQMYNVKVEIEEMGGAPGCLSDPELGRQIEKIAQATGIFNEIIPVIGLGASEDCTYFMERVQERGGHASYLMIGSELAAGHHNDHFDFNEEALYNAVFMLSSMAKHYLTNK